MNAREIEPEITDDDYEDVLNEIYGDIDVCGISYPAGQTLKEIDPTTFRCGKVDYEDSLDHKWKCDECGTEYNDEDEAEECCQESED